MTILDEILENKRYELDAARRQLAPDELARRAGACGESVRGFRRALVRATPPAVIAELKRRSPSRGEMRPDFDPVACARAFERGGAVALSVLTDARYFGGKLETLGRVRASVALPLLRKDFLIDRYQVDEARVHGADAILLIAAALAPEALIALRKRALELGLDCLVEVHDEGELETALAAGADLIGVNNRDLRTFEVDLGVTERLARRIPGLQAGHDPGSPGPDQNGILLVAESGISKPADLRRLEFAGASACLVGESLMREPDLELALARLRRKP
ncbi:MAG: indole-3-glycerol phosphate synthase TrpC [Myxococcota bacterium]